MSATVIADVFSGMPNPEWTIAGELLVQLKLMLEHLPAAAGALPEPPGLGYRGLILQFSPEEGISGPLRLFQGYVLGPEGSWLDTDRGLERWLLQTGIRILNADILSELLRQIR